MILASFGSLLHLAIRTHGTNVTPVAMIFAMMNGNSSRGVDGKVWSDLFNALMVTDYKIAAAEEKAYYTMLNNMKAVLTDVKADAAKR